MIDCSVDSTALVDLLRNKRSVSSILLRFSKIGISHIALGELLLGAVKSKSADELQRISFLVEGMTLLPGNATTSIIYAGVRRDLENKGTMIPQNDIWIAAASIQADVPLITNDAHFRRIPELKLLEY